MAKIQTLIMLCDFCAGCMKSELIMSTGKMRINENEYIDCYALSCERIETCKMIHNQKRKNNGKDTKAEKI